MKNTLVILLLVGLVCGPFYLLYCKFFSGSEIQTFTVYKGDASYMKIGNFSTSSSGGGKWKKPVSIALSTDMNPISAVAKIEYIDTKNLRMTVRKEVTFTLVNAEGKGWKEKKSFSFGNSQSKKSSSSSNVVFQNKPTMSEVIKTFTIKNAGTYTLSAVPTGESRMGRKALLTKVEVEFRKNVIIARKQIYIAGFALLILSIIGFFVTSKGKKPTAA